jgi:hypothetical protein
MHPAEARSVGRPDPCVTSGQRVVGTGSGGTGGAGRAGVIGGGSLTGGRREHSFGRVWAAEGTAKCGSRSWAAGLGDCTSPR